jgi:hypothetical protein
MKTPSRLPAKLALLLLFSSGARADGSVDGLNALAWLAGCWSQEKAETGSMEMWMAPAGGAMLGMSRTVRNGKTVAHEFMQIRADSNALVFIAQPSNQREARFRATRTAELEVVFENPEHDFPQRIIYRLSAPGVLSARIEGMRDGKLHGIDYPMKRMACG